MSDITYGSIIHLESGRAGWGFLETRGWVDDKPVITKFHDPRIRSFVFTHESKNRSMGSGSWVVLSAEGKASGDPVSIGDKVYLESVFSGAGYLDTFEWVRNLEPFKAYPMDNGVFTCSEKHRGGGPTGTWTILADNKTNGDPLNEGDHIFLNNGFSGAGFLYAYGEGKVTEHPMFTDYAGEQKFVFTSTQLEADHAERSWKVVLASPPKNPHNLYYVWGQMDGAWRDLGAFAFSGRAIGIVRLDLSSEDEGKTLYGHKATNDEATIELEAKRQQDNSYVVYKKSHETAQEYEEKVGQWRLGGRNDRRIVAIDVLSTDNGRSFHGTITYAGEAPMVFKGIQATPTLLNDKKGESLLYSFFQPDLWQTRIDRISDALVTAVNELNDILLNIDGFSFDRLTHIINKAGGKSITYLVNDYNLLKSLEKDIGSGHKYRLSRVLQNIDDTDGLIKQLQIEMSNQSSKTRTNFNHLNEKLLLLLKSTPFPLPLDRRIEPAESKSLPANALESTDEVKAPETTEDTHDAVDSDFQIKQLLNIYTLWLSMDEFWGELSQASKNSIKTLNQANILPPVDQIKACFRQFTIDFEIIQNCIRQRRWVKDSATGSTGNIQSASLIVTDKLAARALAPLKHLITDSADVIPLTFFNKKVFIRQMPYTDQFILVGLTYDLTLPTQLTQQGHEGAVSPPLELMAIPHEIGHFMYRHAHLVNSREHDTFAGMSDQFKENPYFDWCEELFADLYGCLIAGPFAVLGLQALIATEEKRMVLEDDDEHPTGIFRPYFLSEMLRILSHIEPDRYQFAEIANILDANWTAILERWGYVPENIMNGRPARINLPGGIKSHSETFVNVRKALQLVRPIMDKFARALLAHATFQPRSDEKEDTLSATIPWCTKNDTTPDASLNDYIDEMKALVRKYAGNKMSDTHLSSKSQMNPSLRQKMSSALRGRHEYIGSELFQQILAGWSAHGPHGFGDHD